MTDKPKPTPGFENLSREEAQRNLSNRALKLKDDIRSLPTNEKLLLAWQFAEEGLTEMAASVAELAARELREKSA